MPPEELRYALLKAIQASPETSQRSLARALGVSVGRVNAGLQQLVERGLVVVTELGQGRRQRYSISRLGLLEKSALATVFIRRKEQQRQQLQDEITQLEADLAESRQHVGLCRNP
ncbi:winged helix-turn-helix transcriptional regulator [Aquisalimonas lutea]|uniref:winged helix-turn-helix transcriptional regulator n=1 Tax=Aquisalimonas lutea TaxID=1327750 RepID=UPI0025B28AB3|nr:winged helix-turn-helix transcriptional regulator [Aquisalimonas lutea]MDN3517814.1 winged helix-turn-helix transcriptional regulator [Aquisalimonas lutea]